MTAAFVFYTNLGSQKGRELAENPRAALCFYWTPIGKQIRVSGRVEPVTPEEADAYFASRDRQSRIGAYASKQSQPLTGYFELGAARRRVRNQVWLWDRTRPEFWSGYRVIPDEIEFWLEMPFRLHQRLVYRREDAATWSTHWLYP